METAQKPETCPQCKKPYERHPLDGVWTCFLHPSSEEQRLFGRRDLEKGA